MARGDLERELASHAGAVLQFMKRHTGDRELAADLTQDALVKAFTALPGFKGGATLKGWLFRIAINTFHDHLRRKRAVSIDLVDDAGERVPETGEGPVQRCLRGELDDELRHQLAHLPERQRSVLLLSALDEFDQKAIADILDISVGAVKVALFHARKKMKGRVERYLGRELHRKRGDS